MATEPKIEQSDNPIPSPSSDHPEEDRIVDVPHGLTRLAGIETRLRVLGLLISGIALASIILISVSAMLVRPDLRDRTYVELIVLPFFGLALLIIWERLKKEGLVLVEEISDELEWDYRKRRQSIETTANGYVAQRPGLDVRIALRRFLKATTLPLVPEQFVTLAYAGVFLTCAFTLVAISVLHNFR